VVAAGLDDFDEEEQTMTNLTAPSEHMALLDIQFDEVQPTRIRRPDADKLVARGQVRLQNIDPEES